MDYFIDTIQRKKYNAGDKAPYDVSRICRKLGMKGIVLPAFPEERGKLYIKLWLLFACVPAWVGLWVRLGKNDSLLIQHPIYGIRIADWFIKLIKNTKGCRTFVLIHDLETLRKGIDKKTKADNERDDIADNILLKRFDKVICHNEKMKDYLVSTGIEASRIVSLEIFDYLCKKTDLRQNRVKSPSVTVAGSLRREKSGYIYELCENKDDRLTLHLYGKGFNGKDDEKVIYHGCFSPEELPSKLEGDFGLVWDGPSAKSCIGNTGEYLKYNDPHKTSLYLAAGMPVIVWEEAAIADFVRENKVGITVKSLFELENEIEKVTDKEYEEMCANASEISKLLRQGFFTERALKKCGIAKE